MKKEKEYTITVLSPEGMPEKDYQNIAQRIPTLEGLRVGLISNRKTGSKEVLEEVKSLLMKRFKNISFKNWDFFHYVSKPSNAVEKHMRQIKKEVDVVVYAHGD